ncbi:Uncharacterised protein [Mycobacterium tuberculosis]|nr:Uncharacterised protein [Mycobacterium tuberculosis]
MHINRYHNTAHFASQESLPERLDQSLTDSTALMPLIYRDPVVVAVVIVDRSYDNSDNLSLFHGYHDELAIPRQLPGESFHRLLITGFRQYILEKLCDRNVIRQMKSANLIGIYKHIKLSPPLYAVYTEYHKFRKIPSGNV